MIQTIDIDRNTATRSIYVGIPDPLLVAADVDRLDHVYTVLDTLQR
jgi:hypothetical protein